MAHLSQQHIDTKYVMRAQEFVNADDPTSWQSQQADARRDAETAKMSAQDAASGGLAEQDLDEKSVSKAQFRTMAAAAHNPEFAKKVGIKQSVAQEFHSADKKSNYKTLPKKTAEGEVDEMLGFTVARAVQPKKPVPSLATMRKEFEKDKSAQIEKPAQGRSDSGNVKYIRKTTDEDGTWGMLEQKKS
jgi:hypothetical protein